ncbi:MAG: membrane integrity-associated transporter subunit PqiC [Chromatiales bacterium]|nr:MAG: membrane integrity-associated transporter subunit PqiC [Chromatiales bacterium]
MTIKRSLWILMVLLAAGCGSSPPVDYYRLQPISGSATADPADAKVLGIGPLQVPGYLDRPQLVTQMPGSEVRVDEFNRWAEPLDVALPRIVTANVDYLLDSVIVVTFPYSSRVRTDYRLFGRVIRFDANQSGEAVLEVQWGVQDADANPVLTPRRTRYTAQASPATDPGAVVSALNETVVAFSRDIAGEIQTRL